LEYSRLANSSFALSGLLQPGSFNCRFSQNTIEQGFDREAHKKKVKEWFMSPVKFAVKLRLSRNVT
jgi:hypothetical protein